MSNQSFSETLIVGQSDGSPLSNTLTATSIIPVAAKLLIPANSWFIGRALRVRATGRISTVVTTPGTFTFTLQLGPTSTIVAATSGGLGLNIIAQTNQTWDLEWLLTCRAIGNAALTTLMHTGKWTSRASLLAPATTTAGVGTTLFPETAPVVGTGFDATVNNTLDMFGAWSVASASNSITVHQYTVEALN